MRITSTKDKSRIAKVTKHQEIWPRISEDGMTDFHVDPDHLYLMDDDDIGLFVVHSINSVLFEVHIQVIPEARHSAMEFLVKVLAYVWENTNAQKLMAMIPEIYPDVIRFAIKGGFHVEGYSRNSYQKDGRLIDQTYVGLERPKAV